MKPIVCPINKKTFQSIYQIYQVQFGLNSSNLRIHLYGSVGNIHEILKLKEKYEFYIVEIVQSLGSRLDGIRAGTFGDIATFSFFGNKLITTGEGGMLITNNKDFYDHIVLIKNHGMSSNNRYWHEVVGTNARMTNIQAAIGLAQLENLDSIVQGKGLYTWNIIKNYQKSTLILQFGMNI